MKYLLYVLAIAHLACPAEAQDAHFSQMYNAPLHLNPAFAGSSPEGKFSFSYRAQWAKMPGDFTTYQASYEYSTPKKPTNFAVMAIADKIGNAGAKSNQIQAFYAHNINLGKNIGLRAGGQVGYGNRSLDYSRLVFGDQLNELGYTGSPSLEQGLPNLSINYTDVGAGLVLYGKDFWIGASGFHLNRPTYNWGAGKEVVPTRYAFQAGFKFIKEPKGKDKRTDYTWACTPAVHYSRQGDFQQLDAGVSLYTSPFLVGLWYRGLPISKNQYGAVVALAGITYKQLAFTYSYDVGTSRFAQSTGGAHEFAMNIRFGDYHTRRKFKRKADELNFPSFMH